MAKKRKPDKLAQDAAAALAAGMSYGNWKAMQPRVEIEEPPIPDNLRICERCGKPFLLKTQKEKRFCEAGCQHEAQVERYQRKRREAAREQKRKKEVVE